MTEKDLQGAIELAYKQGFAEKAFVHSPAIKNFVPRSGCVRSVYSSEEAVECSVLLAFYFELHGTPDYLDVPWPKSWNNSVTDLIWPGAYYFVQAAIRLKNAGSWAAIRCLLPAEAPAIRESI